MKFYFKTIASFFLLLGIVNGQSPTTEWATQITSSDEVRGYSVTTDKEGNVYTGGGFYSAITVETKFGTETINSEGYVDAFIQKQSPDGEVLWIKTFGTKFFESINSVHVAKDGSVFVGGFFEGQLLLPTSGKDTLTSKGDKDIMIAKYTGDGEMVYARSFGGIGNDEISSITTDSNGDIYASGSFSRTMEMTTTTGSITLTADGSTNGVNMKFNADGELLWANGFGNGGFNYSDQIGVGDNGNIYSFGLFRGSISFTSASGTINLNSNGSSDLILLKQNGDGEILWAKSFGGSDFEYANGAAFDNDGNSYFTGIFTGSIDMGNGFSLESNGKGDIVNAKIDKDGNTVWANSFGSASEEFSYGMAIDGNGNVYSTGLFSETVELGSGADRITLKSKGEMDIYVYLQDPNGKPIFAESFGGVLHDSGNAISVDRHNVIYVSGGFSDEVDFGGPEGVLKAKDLDAFTIKMLTSLTPNKDIKSSSKAQFLVYPNPTNNDFNILFDDLQLEIVVSVIATDGKVIHEKVFYNSNNVNLNIADQPSGVYFVKIKTASEIQVQRVVKNK